MDGSMKKQDDSSDRKDGKPLRTLNRVPRACNACRKQKMRCEGADSPPCRRCRNAGLECLFEKPSREATLTGEAGLERIRNLETHVFEIKQSQATVLAILADIQAHLRPGAQPGRSPSSYAPLFQQGTSPAVSSVSPSIREDHVPPSSNNSAYPQIGQPQIRQGRPLYNNRVSSSDPQTSYSNGGAPAHATPSLPPISSMNSRPNYPQHTQSRINVPLKRHRSSTLNLTNSSSLEDDDDDDLPASGLVAPWEVLRGLADVAIERAAKENGDPGDIPSRPRTASPDSERPPRPTKRRKRDENDTSPVFQDVVTKSIISETDAQELFRIFYAGCSTFLPVFDAQTDTYELLHERSPFAVNCICMIAARVRDGGRPSHLYRRCLEEVQAISCATLFSPVTNIESVQAMLLVSGWSDNGWLSGGHAVRMGLELSLHKVWPNLREKIRNNEAGPEKDRELVVATRTWFCLYLFEHQQSYGTGRPAVLKDDDSIAHGRLLLQHPLAIEDDMRLVSTVELMALRERLHNSMSPMDQPVRDQDFDELRRGDLALRGWYATWDHAFSQKYADAAFYRQSLQFQHITAELYHNATALRGIHGPDDVERMPLVQRELAIRSIEIARQALDITVHSPAYAEGMKYAVHYTHATATFAASFLLRLARLFPEDCNLDDTRRQVELLANHMSRLPGRRYALTLQVMLKRSKKRSMSRSPAAVREMYPSPQQPVDPSGQYMYAQVPEQQQHHQHNPHQATSPVAPSGGMGPENVQQTDAENIWRGYETIENAHLPVWMSDNTLGGNTFSQDGMNAFLLPANYMPATSQMW